MRGSGWQCRMVALPSLKRAVRVGDRLRHQRGGTQRLLAAYPEAILNNTHPRSANKRATRSLLLAAPSWKLASARFESSMALNRTDGSSSAAAASSARAGNRRFRL